MVSFTGSSETPTQNTSASPSSYPDAAEPKLEQDLPRDESNVTQFNTSHGPSSRGVVGAAVLHARTTVCHAARVVHAACINPIVWIIVAYVAWTSLSGTINPFIESPRTADCNSSSKLDRTTGCPTPELFSPNFRKLVTFQSRFQGAMEESTSASIIAVDIKRSEMAIRDLTTLVDLSSIVSKGSLAKNLRKFVEDARTTGRGLQKFGGHIRSAVDQIVTLNEHAIDLLERSIKDTQPQLDHGLFRRAIKGLYRDKPVPCEVIEARNREIKGVWVEAIGTMKSSIEKLIIEAAVNAKALDRLEGHLSVIYNIASRADKKAAQDKSELLGRLWTSLGGNKAQLAEYDSHLQLLNAVQNYRKDAANHVTSTILQLQQMELDLIDMNEMVATSTLSRKDSEAGTSLMSHIATIQKGTDKLLRGRASIRERENNYMQKVFGNLH